jgi:putative membrane-bound dehydrogenase-like protein
MVNIRWFILLLGVQAFLFGLFNGQVLRALQPTPESEQLEGVLPRGADGKPLNLDFETGTLKDWVAAGTAFTGQPVEGDIVHRRRRDMQSNHQGQYWIGTYEVHGDKAQGTLTSVPFKVTHPWASFLIGGGALPDTCVELVQKDTGKVFSRTAGLDEENMQRVAVDLQPHMGKEIFIRLVDKSSSAWGHLNFDDFRFHSAKPNFPERQAPETLPPHDVYKYAGLPPQKAAEVMTVPPGFQVKLFAGEPDVRQPIAMCLDDRGRVWIAEAYTYPVRRRGKGPLLNLEKSENKQPGDRGDRILIFEDTDGDGKFDKCTVFMEGLNLVSGLEVGFGGVWIGAAPYLLFVPMKEGEDKPAGPPQILLDGWAYQDTHETLNTFTWGPDGWLYGCHGVFTHSRVGKPGTSDDKRTRINAGIWRYHPTKHIFEVFAHGTSNPWGIDFDEHGELFCEACVIPHLFHIFQGGRYHRQAGDHFNRHTYADIQTIADHRHFVTEVPHAGNERSDSAGGGHAHCGLMIYQGGAWPAKYQGMIFIGNIHGHRLNVDWPKPRGSGFIASHGHDFLLANDAWARFINFQYGPDGNVYLIDWYDKQACHSNDNEAWDRTNGRIYKICYRGTKTVRVNLQKCSDEQLVQYLGNENEWFVRHACRILQERYGNRDSVKTSVEPFIKVLVTLEKMATQDAVEATRLRALWALYAVGGLRNSLDENLLKRLLEDISEYVRAWAIRLSLEDTGTTLPASFLARLAEMAKSDPSPIVRRYLASGLQRIPQELRWDIIANLVTHPLDAADSNLPLMYWYATEPLAERNNRRALELARRSMLPPLFVFMVRRISSIATPEALGCVIEGLAHESDPNIQLSYLVGMQDGLKGHRQVPMPSGWSDTYARLSKSGNTEVRQRATSLAVQFGDPQAFKIIRELVRSPRASSGSRLSGLQTLLAVRDKELAPLLHELVKDSNLRGAALRGLATYDDPKTPEVILAAYASFSSKEKRDALNTLASRVAYGKTLMDAVASKRIPTTEISADIVRQLRNLKDRSLDQRIADVWGVVRNTPADRAKMITGYKKLLSSHSGPQELSLGRAMFAKVCQQCHTFFGTGGKVGPELTGSNRGNLDYLLENIVDPSAVIPKEYAATVIELKDGRFVTGIVRGETQAALTVVTANETLTVPRSDIESLSPSAVSMMPEDLLKPLSSQEIRALLAYLRTPNQVPMQATADNVKEFFNGKDLTGWEGAPGLWSVENGEIVGRSPGIKQNEFLKSEMAVGDFRLKVKVKLVPNAGNSGIQFRSEALSDGEMKGPQADIGAGWWGKLYEENGRGVIHDNPGESFVKPDDWNDYEVVAVGSRIRTYINGHLCVDLDDPAGQQTGIFGLQIHAGGPMEVRFKDVRLELNPSVEKK